MKEPNIWLNLEWKYFAVKNLRIFLYGDFQKSEFGKQKNLLESFASLDDFDVLSAIKEWQNSSDYVLKTMCRMLVSRNLLKIKMQKTAIDNEEVARHKNRILSAEKLNESEVGYFVFQDSIDNMAYEPAKANINLLYKDGSIRDIAEAADLLNISALSEPVKKHFLCYPSGDIG